jgi:transposase
MRDGAEFFTSPAEPTHRRYEALRAYLVDGEPAQVVGRRFGYSPATIYQMAAELRAGRAAFFRSSKPGPKGPRQTATLRERVLALRAADRSVKEIADTLTAEGSPISHQSVWLIVSGEGLSRLPPRARRGHGPAPRTEAVKAAALADWPAGTVMPCAHAGLFVLFPAMVELGVDAVIAAGSYPSTSALSSWQSMASLLTLKLLRAGRVSHATELAADTALGLAVGLNVLPKATHATSYSYRVRREHNTAALTALVARLRQIGLASGDAGFNLDFHSIRHHGVDAPLDDNYVATRSQATRSVLAFFAQDHASTEMVYANADVTKAEAAREILAFADHWKAAAGADPGLLVFDSRLTTYAVLDELNARGIDWLTLRQRGKAVLARLAALPASAWRTARIDRAGRYRHPQLHDETVTINRIANPVRQLAVRNIGRDQPTLLISNDHTTSAKHLFARYAERMLIENELAAYINGFHLDALSSGLALNIDVDTTLTVIAGTLYRLLARSLKRYEHITPERLHRHFVDTTGTITVAHDHVSVALTRRTFTPVLLQAGYAELDLPIPWWGGRRLRFTFPPQ